MREDINYNKIIDGEEFDRAQQAANEAEHLPGDMIDVKKMFVAQNYARYSDENHEVWEALYRKRWEKLEEQASRTFIAGLKAINLIPERVPMLDGSMEFRGETIHGINTYLGPLTGWQSRAVPGYLPAKAFFACLAGRDFPTTVTIRPKDRMDYLPEPDIFHDVFGHVPLHADEVFAEFLQTYGKAALAAGNEHTEALARLFWFTVEFGLIREEGRIKIYGSGLISSHGESAHALEAPEGTGEGMVERRPFDLERVVSTPFEIDHYQPILYVLESFEQLRDAMNEYADRVMSESKVSM